MVKIIFCWLFLTLAIAVKDDGCRKSCKFEGETNGERIYKLYDNTTWMVETSPGFLFTKCAGIPLTDPAVPILYPSLTPTPPRLLFAACPLPDSSIRDALLALNADSQPSRVTLRDIPLNANISRHHFEGYSDLYYLDISAARGAEISIAADAFTVFRNLTELHLNDVHVNPEAIPASLIKLYLSGNYVKRFGQEWTSRLPSLQRLSLNGANLAEVSIASNASNLMYLTLRGSSLEIGVVHMPNVKEVSLFGVGKNFAIPGQWKECRSLKKLMISSGPDVSTLPDAWLSNLTSLTNVSFLSLGIERLPSNMFEGTTGLQEFEAQNCKIDEIPEDLFRGAKDLVKLDLSYNRIRHIPDTFLDQVPSLQHLVLSHNRLTSAAWAAAVPGAGAALRLLLLDRNPLGDTCEPAAGGRGSASPGLSSLRGLSQLSRLSLARTGATALCTDWRLQFSYLARLDLSGNNITDLDASSFVWVREVDSQVLLRYNPISAVLYTMEDYMTALKIRDGAVAEPSTGVIGIGSVSMDLRDCPLACDCSSFWFASALIANAPPPRVALRPAPCVQPAPVETCPIIASQCFSNCECAASTRRPLAPPLTSCTNVSDELLAYEGPLNLKMERVGLEYVPKLLRPANMSLAYNRIVDGSLPDLADGVQEVDLRNNSITLHNATIARLLFNRTTTVRLSGNPLRCRCDNADSVAVVQQHKSQIPDYFSVHCSDGTPVWKVRPSDLCAKSSLWWIAFVIVATAVCGVATVFLWPQLVLRVKLIAKCIAPTESDDIEYDVFVSYAHPDHEVCQEIIQQLEKSRKVCVHYRDWKVGDWIPAQISRSVRSARRTLALVSPHYCDSRWTPAEVREAIADSDRLIVVFLSPVSDDQLARVPELRDHVARKTYIEYRDPLFWARLLAALPVAKRDGGGVPMAQLDTSPSA